MSDKKNNDKNERDQYYHNKGQEDASKGKYDKPHSFPFDGGRLGMHFDI